MKSKMLIQIGLISLTLVLVGCGQNNQPGRQTVQVQPNMQNPGGGPFNPGSTSMGAEFQVQGPSLQQSLQQLLSVNATPTTVGTFGQTADSGVFITALINLNMPIQQAMGAGGQIVSQGSFLALRARDSESGQIDPATGAPIKDISVRITPQSEGFNVTGQIQGGRFNAIFADRYGQIMIDGVISGQTIQGQIGFQNPGTQAMSIGQFNTSVCALFRCQ